MNTIRATARSLIAEEGGIGAIIDLLEDPEDARYNLKPEIEAVKKSAKKCLDNAQGIASSLPTGIWSSFTLNRRHCSAKVGPPVRTVVDPSDVLGSVHCADYLYCLQQKRWLKKRTILRQRKSTLNKMNKSTKERNVPWRSKLDNSGKSWEWLSEMMTVLNTISTGYETSQSHPSRQL